MGAITFFFAEIEGYRGLSPRLGPRAERVLRQYHSLLRRACADQEGRVVSTDDDRCFAVFPRGAGALLACIDAQRAVAKCAWSADQAIRVRITLHAVEQIRNADDYLGPAMQQAARISAAANGWQVLVSQAAAGLVGLRLPDGAHLADLGEYYLKDFDNPQRLYQLCHADLPETFPPLRAPRIEERSAVIGRALETRVLGEKLNEAKAGGGGLVLIAGEPGIGKSTLMAEAVHLARRAHMTVAWGRCREDGGAPPYLPWVQVVQSVVAAGLAGHDWGPGWSDVSWLIDPVPASVPAAADTSHRFRLFAALSSVLGRAADGHGLLVVLDDLHKADEGSLAFLRYLAPELAQLPIVVVAAYRDGEVDRDHPLTTTVGLIADGVTVSTLHLGCLDGAGVAALIDRHAGPVPIGVAQTVATRTSGNPLFVIELAGLLRSTQSDPADLAATAIPSTVRDVIAQRVGRLPAETRHALRAAAVLGRDFGRLPLADVVGASELAVVTALQPAAVARLISPGPAGRYRFTHALVQAAVYEAIDIGERTNLHCRAVAAISALGTDDDESLTDLAFHSYHGALGGDPEPALRHSLAAGRRARQRLGFEEAARWLSLAIELAERRPQDEEEHFALLVEAAEMDLAAGRTASARARFERGAGIARRLDGRALTRAALGVGSTVVSAAKVDWGLVALLEEATAAATEESDRARLQSRLAIELYWYEEGVPSRVQSLAALRTAEKAGDEEVLAAALQARQYTLRGPEGLEERIAIGEHLVTLTQHRRHSELGFQAALWLALDMMRTGNFSEVRRLIGVLLAAATRSCLPRQRWYATAMEASLAAIEGRVDEAFEKVEAAASLGQSLGQEHAAPFRLGQLAVLCREREGLAGLRAEIEEVASRLPYFVTLRSLTALAAATAGQPDAAAWEVDRLSGDSFAAVPRDSLWVATVALLTEAAAISGSPHTHDLLEQLTPHRGRMVVQGIPCCWGSVDRFLGRAHLALGHWKEADDALRAAAGIESAIGAPLFVSRTNLDRARLAMLTGRRDQAGRLAAEVTATATRLGLVALAQEAADVVRELAAENPKLSPLSRREREVLTLVSTGASNKDIAVRLVISLNTVERHLSNIYTKLAVRGRADATAYAVRSGLVTATKDGGSP